MVFPYIGKGVIAYLNDLLVYNEDAESHAKLLEVLLKTLEGNEMYPNVSKCLFGCSEMAYLGYAVIGRGVTPRKEKVRAIEICKKMSEVEPQNAIYDQELLALVTALERWRRLLLHAEVTVPTDRRGLQYLLQLKGDKRARGRVARWSDFLVNFDRLTGKYKPGSEHAIADALTGLPIHKNTANVSKSNAQLVTHRAEEMSAIAHEIRGQLQASVSNSKHQRTTADNKMRCCKPGQIMKQKARRVEELIVDHHMFLSLA
ncbi:hypothetical protein Efla_004548 [Eimeria flavescens]